MAGSGTTSKEGGSTFPTTRWTVIRDAKDPASPAYRESLEHLAVLYWKPIYAYFRRKWNKKHEEAADLTQEFFIALCEKDFLQHLSPEHGRFRHYVMAALDNFARLEFRARSAQKRGGGVVLFSIDAGDAFQPSGSGSPEDTFLREWARSLLAQAIQEMKEEFAAQGQGKIFALFTDRDLEPPPEGPASYEDLAARHGLSATDVTNALYRARKRLREIVLGKVRDTVTTEKDAEAEMRELFGRRLAE